ncbi:recombinase family protein [Variovorax sp. Varisp85]|uniref:recombinase family protein n=1 Tax=Variovorax sp. Varisp85 TaxID=3243059 RepID=UPI0039A4A947
MLVGYARVSTAEQEADLQLRALKRYGVRRVFWEKGSGVGPRPELQRLLESLRAGDTLVVWKLDRIARSMQEVLRVMDVLKLRDCGFRSLTEPIDTSHSFGELALQMIAAFAQFERSLIRERCEAGRVAARARGVLFGRQPLVTGEEADLAARLYREGFTLGEVAVLMGVSPTAVRSALMRGGVGRRAWGGPRFRRLS